MRLVQEEAYPMWSHGFDAVLTNVHRAHPELSYACVSEWLCNVVTVSVTVVTMCMRGCC